MRPFDELRCPLDQADLTPDESGKYWRCSHSHSFDVASKGYLNLLPVQAKRSREPGDSKTMVAARRAFLESGFYRPIAEMIAEHVWRDVPVGTDYRVLDAGCGEGYYDRVVAEKRGDRSLSLLGLDVSKYAVMAACRERNARWIVASNANIPARDASLDCVVSAFGFPVYGEFSRVLKDGGVYICVDAGPEHLRQLREIVYPQAKEEVIKTPCVPEAFERIEQQPLQFNFTLPTPQRIQDLFAMTPHAYRAPQSGRQALAALGELTLTADIMVSRYQRVTR